MDLYFEISQMKKVQEETFNMVKNLCTSGIVDNNREKVYDLKDLEDRLHVSRRTLFKWKSEGKMKFSQVGKKIFITDVELQKFLETNKQD